MATATHELQESKTLGASWVRLGVPWPAIETARGTYDWTRADALWAASKAVGEPILPVLMWTPQWAGGGTALDLPPTNVADWTAFVTAFTQRYGTDVPAIDVWNEPDSGNYLYNGSAQTYVSDLLNPAYAAIKAVAPSLPVVEAGSANDAGGGTPFLSAVMADGGKFDIASFHNYVGTYSSEAAAYRSALNAAGRGSTPIWMTEFGVPSATGNQSSAIASAFGVSDLAAAAWYNLRDTGAWSCTATACTQVDTATWGLLQANFTPKPSFAAMQSILGGSAPAPSPSPTVTVTPTPSPSPSTAPTPTPSPSPTSTPPPATSLLALHRSGNQIVDSAGKAVTLRGVDMSGTEFVCAQNWTNDPFGGQPEDSPATFAAMHSWGINAVRIPLNEDCWLGINGVQIGGGAYQAPVEKLVRDLERSGFYVILDLHW
ncbi:MAG: cellulase family glycosylhydrolase, partial [Trebonia sp.]